jgi:hypothetical protein
MITGTRMEETTPTDIGTSGKGLEVRRTIKSGEAVQGIQNMGLQAEPLTQ